MQLNWTTVETVTKKQEYHIDAKAGDLSASITAWGTMLWVIRAENVQHADNNSYIVFLFEFEKF